MARGIWGLAAALLAGLALAATASAHPERPSFYPNYAGKVPQYRTTGPTRVVCTGATAGRIARMGGGGSGGDGESASRTQSGSRNRSSIVQQGDSGGDAIKRRNEVLLERCRYRTIQAAINAARNGDRILVMPGTYTEEPSRRVPNPDPRCAGDYTASEGDPTRPLADLGTGVNQLEQGTERAPTYAHHRKCPNSLNLIAIVGDRLGDPDRRCDDKCNLQIEGTGAKPTDVKIIGSRNKDNVIRADRADGVVLRNFQVQFSDFNNIYVHETNGFRESDILTRWSREYGALSFTSDHGLYERIRGYGTGDSVIYPGSGPQRARCGDYGIEVRDVDAHHSTIGYSGTAGDSVYVHDSKFHHNSAGLTTDSFASGHPGMPQDCSRFENNQFYSNNVNYFNDARDRYCRDTPPRRRDRTKVCPSFQVPVGTGLLIAGGNGNVVKNNFFFDNWRNGVRLLWVPAAVRGEPDLAKQRDTSNHNRFVGNQMGFRPSGVRDPNGNDPNAGRPTQKGDGYADFWWDQEGAGNCWRGNRGPGGRAPTTNGFRFACPVTAPPTPAGDPAKTGSQASCAAWDPNPGPTYNPDPTGCDWFRTPPEPR